MKFLLLLFALSAVTFLNSCKTDTTSSSTGGSKPVLQFSPDTLNFGTSALGKSISLQETITNPGSSPVTIQTIVPVTVNSSFAVSGLPLTIAPNGSQTVTVTVTPKGAGVLFERFSVTTTADSVFVFYAKDSVSGIGATDSVVYSFVVMGCNRISKGDFNVSTDPSSANLPQLDRTFSEIAALTPKPNLFFAMGDLVLGESDSITLVKQLIAWKAHFEASPVKAAGIELVPIPGNHETEDANGTPQAFGEQAWLAIMSPYILRGGNGPKPHTGDPDGLHTDQSNLTYSFDYNDAHFVVISTDPAGLDSDPPGNWIAADITAAHNNPATKHIFAIGHKPAFAYDGGTDGLSKIPANRDLIWNALDNTHAEGMLSAHNHTYKAFRPTNKSWMVIAGNGGSSLETTAPRFYGFTVVQILKSGTVIERTYGRDFGSSYNDPCPASTYPTTVRDSNIISW